MAIFSAKILAIIGASVIGIGAVATGIGVAVSRNSATTVSQNDNVQPKPDSNGMVNDDSNSGSMGNGETDNISLSATVALAGIDQSKISFGSSMRNETYAFNVDVSKIKLPEQEELQTKGINFKISLDKQNTTQKLNEGEIKLQVIAYRNEAKKLAEKLENQLEDEEEIAATQIDPTNISIKVFEFKDFKPADASLLELLNKTDKSTLDLLKVKGDDSSSETYKTLDELNEKSADPKMENGFTKLLRAQMGDGQPDKTKDVTVEGKAILEKVEVDTQGEANNKTVFYLKAADSSHPLKLIKQMGDNGTKTEVLVGTIRTTNLLPNEIELMPVGFEETKTEAAAKKIKEDTSSNHYKVFKKEGGSETIFINLDGTNSNEPTRKDVVVNPYVYAPTSEEVTELKFELKVVYGKENYQTALDLKDGYGAEMLKTAEFSFNVYVKKVDSMENPLDGMKLKTELQKYPNIFAEAKYSMPQMSNMVENSQMPSKGTLKVSMQNQQVSVMLSSPDNKVAKQTAANLIAFVGFAYKGVAESSLFFLPSVTTIHYEKGQVSA